MSLQLCTLKKYNNSDHRYIITGDLKIIQHIRMKNEMVPNEWIPNECTIMKNGTKFQPPSCTNMNDIIKKLYNLDLYRYMYVYIYVYYHHHLINMYHTLTSEDVLY